MFSIGTVKLILPANSRDLGPPSTDMRTAPIAQFDHHTVSKWFTFHKVAEFRWNEQYRSVLLT